MRTAFLVINTLFCLMLITSFAAAEKVFTETWGATLAESGWGSTNLVGSNGSLTKSNVSKISIESSDWYAYGITSAANDDDVLLYNSTYSATSSFPSGENAITTEDDFTVTWMQTGTGSASYPTPASVSVGLRFGLDWYISNQVFSTTVAYADGTSTASPIDGSAIAGAWDIMTFEFDPTASGWSSLNTSNWSRGATLTEDLSGEICGVALFFESSTSGASAARINDLVIETAADVPEPSTFAMLVALGLALPMLLRRKEK